MTQPSASPTSANSIADCGRPVWDMARRDYEAGQTAGAVCAHYGLTESALRSRAHRHDWKRSEPEAPDQSLLDLQSAARSDNDAEPLEFEDMIDQAWNHFERALSAARSSEAARWFKLTEALEARRDRLARKAEDDLILSMLDRFDAIGATNATMKSETRTTSPSPKGDGEDRRSPERQEGASPARPIPTETLQQLHARRRAEAARSTAGAIGATNATAKPADPATPPSGALRPACLPHSPARTGECRAPPLPRMPPWFPQAFSRRRRFSPGMVLRTSAPAGDRQNAGPKIITTARPTEAHAISRAAANAIHGLAREGCGSSSSFLTVSMPWRGVSIHPHWHVQPKKPLRLGLAAVSP